jgi:hypothetical protein
MLRPVDNILTVQSSTLDTVPGAELTSVPIPVGESIMLPSLVGTNLVFTWMGGDSGDILVTIEGTTQVCVLLLLCLCPLYPS